jgi:hypothetical protein
MGDLGNSTSVVILRERSESKDPRILCGFLTRFALFAVLILALAPRAAHAQGCAQCLDSTQATPPAVQSSYRHAIYLLGGAGATLFLAGLYLLRREP